MLSILEVMKVMACWYLGQLAAKKAVSLVKRTYSYVPIMVDMW